MRKKALKIIVLLLFSTPLHALPKNPDYPLAKGLLTAKTLSYLDRYYYAPERLEPPAMFEAALAAVQRSIPEVLAKCEKKKFCAVTVNQAVKRFRYPEGGMAGLKNRLREIFAFVERHMDPQTERSDVEYAAIIGLLEEMDPHSNFMSPEAYREFRVGTEGEFGGLGIVISIKEGRLVVTAPIEGTPAWKAGMKPGDHIFQIDEESTINMDLTEAVTRLRGRPGSRVILKVEREGKKGPLTFTLTRAIINIEAVQSQLVTTEKKRPVGFLKIKSFQSNTRRDVLAHLKELHKKAPKLAGVILDLRNNPGGLLDQAVLLADLFLKEGTIVSTVGRAGKLMDRKKAGDDGLEKDFPLIVLVNEGSASASEIVAGAVKNNERGIVVGTTTFGKGTVQSIYELPLEAAVKITVGQYYTPGDQSIQSVGIAPDIELFPVRVDKEHLDTIENIHTFEKDLEKHLERETAAAGQPAFRLRFLDTAAREEEEQEYKTKLDLNGDTAAGVALGLMDVLTQGARPAMLKEAGPLIERKQKEEEEKIAGAFQKFGINWTHGKLSGKKRPQAQLSYHLLQNGKTLPRAKAGEEVTLKIKVQNVGDVPFHQLAAQTDSKIYSFRNFEFAFGRIDPGQSKTWENRIKIPKSNPTEEVLITQRFSELNGQAPPPVDILLPIQELPRPHFAHQFSLEPETLAKLKRGEPVTMEVEVANEGKGPALQPVAALKNLGGREVFIEKGRAVLKELPARQKEKAQFLFHIDPQSAETRLRFELSITDAELFVRSSQELLIDLEGEIVTPSAGQWFRGPTITLARQEGRVGTDSLFLQGEAEDDRTIRDIYIFVGEEKTFYEANAKGEKKLSFKTPITLQEGNNTILITARDDDNLVSTHLKIIRFEPAVVQKGAL